MKTKHMVLTMILIIGTRGTLLTAKVIYVDVAASGNRDGSSWLHAYRHLQNALLAAESGDEIYVAEGLYRPDQGQGITPGDRHISFSLINGVTLYGGFPTGGSNMQQRDPDAYETVLSGDLNGNDGPDFENNSENSYHVIIGSNTNTTAVLDGFTVSGGNADGTEEPDFRGGGMYIEYGIPTIRNCLFSANTAQWGAGIHNESSSPTLTDCVFKDNHAGFRSGGIYNRTDSSPVCTNCVFIGNSAVDAGGGMGNGGGGANPELKRCIFAENTAEYGGGMSNRGSSSPTLVNCTFWGNFASNSGGGLWNYSDQTIPNMTNCILWNNRDRNGNGESAQVYNGAPIIRYSCIQGLSGELGGIGNMDADPMFVDAYNGDFHLKSRSGRWDSDLNQWAIDQTTSPCIDAGDPNANWTAELWPHGMRINLGAFGGTRQASMSSATTGNIADLNNNGFVNLKDLLLLSNQWLSKEALLCEDLNRNGSVDFNDYAVLADHWHWQGPGWDPYDNEAIAELRRLINEEYSYWQLRGIDWDILFDSYCLALNDASTSYAFAELTAELLGNAEDMHIRVYVGEQYFRVYKRSVEHNYNLDVLPTLVPSWQQKNDRVSTGYYSDGNIGYIGINNWSSTNSEQLDAVFQALDTFRDTDGLILDVRANSGGSEPLAKQVAGCFVTQSMLYAKHRYRDITEPDGFGPVTSRWLDPNPDQQTYSRPVVVLMGEVCMSSCDAFLLMMKQVTDCALVGSTSYGSSGNSKPHSLGNGVTVDLPSWLALRPDGTCFEGEGISPHITVEATEETYLTSDPVLEAGLNLLRN